MILVHRCAICRHNSLEAKVRGNGVRCGIDVMGGPPCCQRCDWGPSELIPTYDSATMKVIREIIPPGSRYTRDIILCDCDECHAMYRNPPRVIL